MEASVQDKSAVSFDALLVKSCRIYKEIDRIYDFLHKDLTKKSQIQMNACIEELQCLMQEARNIDSLMQENFQQQNVQTDETKELLQTRRDLIALLQWKNRKVKQNAENVKSHLRHEISKFSKNRAALKGYKPAMNVKRCLINTTR